MEWAKFVKILGAPKPFQIANIFKYVPENRVSHPEYKSINQEASQVRGTCLPQGCVNRSTPVPGWPATEPNSLWIDETPRS